MAFKYVFPAILVGGSIAAYSNYLYRSQLATTDFWDVMHKLANRNTDKSKFYFHELAFARVTRKPVDIVSSRYCNNYFGHVKQYLEKPDD